MLLQNAEALVKWMPVGIMGQAQSSGYRNYVEETLKQIGNRNSCSSPNCQSQKSLHYGACENWFDWWHIECAHVSQESTHFCCDSCSQRIQ